jgi:hypothetical protein
VAYPVFRGAADAATRGSIDIALLAQIPLTVLVLGSLGVALSRWIRHPVVAPTVLVAHVMTGLIWIVPLIGERPSGIRMGWHYTYLLSAIVLWVSLALAGDRRQLRAFEVPAASFVAVVVSASLQVPPGG